MMGRDDSDRPLYNRLNLTNYIQMFYWAVVTVACAYDRTNEIPWHM